jgi:hypothetical protein
MNHPRYWHDAVLLGNGRVLVVGGITTRNSICHPEIYVPATNSWLLATPNNDIGEFPATASLPTAVFGGRRTEPCPHNPAEDRGSLSTVEPPLSLPLAPSGLLFTLIPSPRTLKLGPPSPPAKRRETTGGSNSSRRLASNRPAYASRNWDRFALPGPGVWSTKRSLARGLGVRGCRDGKGPPG